MDNEKNSIGDFGKMVIGGAAGLLFGLGLSTTVAWLTDGFFSSLTWIIIPHITFAMTLTGIWTVPCFLPESDDPVVQERQADGRDGALTKRSVVEKDAAR